MGQARRISQALVIGAREETRQIASTLLEETGLNVIEAESMEEGAELLMRHARKLSFVFAEAGSSLEARALALLVANNWPWIRVLVAMDRASITENDLPASASRLNHPWRPLDLLIEAERAMQ